MYLSLRIKDYRGLPFLYAAAVTTRGHLPRGRKYIPKQSSTELRRISTHIVADTVESKLPRGSSRHWYKLLQSHDSVTLHLMEVDLSHAAPGRPMVRGLGGTPHRWQIRPRRCQTLHTAGANAKVSPIPLSLSSPSLGADTVINEHEQWS